MIVVTGGAGSIGSEVVRRLLGDGCAVRAFDISEEGLWSLKAELPEVETVLGDVQSLDDVNTACQGASVVIHCAALKHVDLCERSPAVAHRINFGGTVNVMRAAPPLCKVVFVSTDKAIEPKSVMGKTKQMAEEYAQFHGANVVRFGNVIGTRGSLVPMVLRCRDLNRPIPLTDPNMTRFFMSSAEAVDLVIEAMESRERGRMFTPVSPRACNVGEFVQACASIYAPHLDIEITGMRPGERLHEPMQLRSGEIVWSDDEAYQMRGDEVYSLLAPAEVAV